MLAARNDHLFTCETGHYKSDKTHYTVQDIVDAQATLTRRHAEAQSSPRVEASQTAMPESPSPKPYGGVFDHATMLADESEITPTKTKSFQLRNTAAGT